MTNPMIIDSVDVFERVVRAIAKQTGMTFAQVLDFITNEEEYIVPQAVFDQVYERLYA